MKKKNYLEEKLNCLSLKKKLLILQVFCVLLPLLITDTFIVNIIIKAERTASEQEMDKICASVKYMLSEAFESAAIPMEKIYSNHEMNMFFEMSFESPLDYYEKYLRLTRTSDSLRQMSSNMFSMVLYASAPGIISGGSFQKIEKAHGTKWYEEFCEQQADTMIFADYIKTNWEEKRTLSLIRRMDYYNKDSGDNILKIDLNYSSMLNSLIHARYSHDVYVCDGRRIIFSNDEKGGVNTPFGFITDDILKEAAIHGEMNVYNKVWDIYVLQEAHPVEEAIRNNSMYIAFLVIANIFLPIGLMQMINHSFTDRLTELEYAIDSVEADEIYELPEISGKDEISRLMRSYNEMAVKINYFIKNEYKNRIRRQESDIARQQAELLALHSQINPHFLFNALESIRMHSLLKKEYETADMVEKLALMERQNVEWGNDDVLIDEELRFAEAYLELQKYRFGSRLNYRIDAEGCENYRIPKLSIVTFVENACIHGMEKKSSSSWIFVHVFKEKDSLVIEIEDTGNGMSGEKCIELEKQMNEVTMEMLKKNKSVGILNAALRLKMVTGGKARFELSSEQGAGTMVTVVLPA